MSGTFDQQAYQTGPRVFPYCPPLTEITQHAVQYLDQVDKTLVNEQEAPGKWPAWPSR